MEKERSLRTRAFFAVVLFFGFYLLALSIVAGLAFLPYLQWKAWHSVNVRLAFFCLAGAGIILWSILPRRDKLEPPGPRLNSDEHPRFFKKIETIARDLNQKMPREVYLIPISNAWVASRGGFMGIGSRRVMAVGIPLLQTLSVPQLAAVLAHEFGHYYGGDVKLGPWIYKTRLAIARTILGLQRHRSILQIPFVLYGNAFLKITSSISRGQELAADRMAASIAGAANIASALRSIHKFSLAFDVYWQEDVMPVLAKGFYPPIVTGFGQFLLSERAKCIMEGCFEKSSATFKPDPFDSHPTLDDRLIALEEHMEGRKQEDSAADAVSTPAMSLLDREASEIEQELMSWVRGVQKPPLMPLSWQEVGQKVWREIWKEGAAQLAVELVHPAMAADFPRLIKKEAPVSLQVAGPQSDLAPPDIERILRILHKYGSALADAMIQTGWVPEVLPGRTVYLERAGIRFPLFEYIDKLARGELSETAWQEVCQDAGILDLRFGP